MKGGFRPIKYKKKHRKMTAGFLLVGFIVYFLNKNQPIKFINKKKER